MMKRLLAVLLSSALVAAVQVSGVQTAGAAGTSPNTTGEPIGGGAGYSETVDPAGSNVTVVSNLDELVAELDAASADDIVYIDDGVVIDAGSTRGIAVPDDVTLAGGRGRSGVSQPGMLRASLTATTGDVHLLSVGEGGRVTGLIIEGPSGEIVDAAGDCSGAAVTCVMLDDQSRGIRLEGDDSRVDNVEARNWPYAAVDVLLSDDAHRVTVQHSDLHHNRGWGRGYGIALSRGDADIEGNTFDFGRHAVSGSGHTDATNVGTGYTLTFNIFGANFYQPPVDMHGSWQIMPYGPTRALAPVDPRDEAGDKIVIQNNDFADSLQSNSLNPEQGLIFIAGEPTDDESEVSANRFAVSSTADVVVQREHTKTVGKYNGPDPEDPDPDPDPPTLLESQGCDTSKGIDCDKTTGLVNIVYTTASNEYDVSFTAASDPDLAVIDSTDYHDDGFADLGVWDKASDGRVDWYVYSGSGSGLSATESQFRNYGGLTHSHSRPLTGDFNGDGHSDLLVWYKNGSTGKVDAWLLRGDSSGISTSVTQYTTWTGFTFDHAWPVVGDFDGDGYDDLLVWYKNGSTGKVDWWIYEGQSGGISTSVSQSGSFTGLTASNSHPVTGDFDGDDYDDLLLWYKNGSTGKVDYWLFPGTASGLSTSYSQSGSITGFTADNTYPVTGDFNGDTYDDLLVWYKNGSTGKVDYWLYPGTSSGLSLAWVPQHSYTDLVADDTRPVAGDFNGDHFEDVGVWYENPSTGDAEWRLYTGSEYGLPELPVQERSYAGHDFTDAIPTGWTGTAPAAF